MKVWKWFVLFGGGVATAIAILLSKYQPKAFIEKEELVEKKKTQAVKKVTSELSQKTDKEIADKSASASDNWDTVKRRQLDIDSAATRAINNIARRLSAHSSRRNSDANSRGKGSTTTGSH